LFRGCFKKWNTHSNEHFIFWNIRNRHSIHQNSPLPNPPPPPFSPFFFLWYPWWYPVGITRK
jgi:hypothetical protein